MRWQAKHFPVEVDWGIHRIWGGSISISLLRLVEWIRRTWGGRRKISLLRLVEGIRRTWGGRISISLLRFVEGMLRKQGGRLNIYLLRLAVDDSDVRLYGDSWHSLESDREKYAHLQRIPKQQLRRRAIGSSSKERMQVDKKNEPRKNAQQLVGSKPEEPGD